MESTDTNSVTFTSILREIFKDKFKNTFAKMDTYKGGSKQN